ncbi:MAG: hypothetical protein K0A94_13080 [Desulfuromonadales bacterium]|nr:hypothetical protein [Desulfuromonadales bacterium]
MKRTLALLLAASLFLIAPAVASASRTGGHGGGHTVVTREKVVIHKTTQQRDHRYDRSDRRDYRHQPQYRGPARHAPAHGYYKNHQPYRHQTKKVVKHQVPVPRNSVIIGVPSVIIRLGF